MVLNTQVDRALHKRNMTLENSRKLIIATAAALFLLTGCDRVVNFNPHPRVTYTIKGNRNSELYPLDVKRNGEDVRIELKKPALIPKIFLLDASGRRIAFDYKMTGSTLIVPGKFDHLQLLEDGSEPIDIYAAKNSIYP